MNKEHIQKPRGTNDILPDEQNYWYFFETTARLALEGLGFKKINTPIFEEKSVYERGVGAGTDIIEKEIYYLQPFNGEEAKYALRPEGTAGVARSYIENGMNSWSQPVRLFYFGPMFRHERPQRGRYREHYQFGAEIFGDQSAESDYLAILSAIEILKKIGFKNTVVNINSIGCPDCRPKYLKILKNYYSEKLESLCVDCQNRYITNPLRMLDCKNESCQKQKINAPVVLDSLCTNCKTHFQEILEFLDDFGIKFNLDNTLVRGLDYYTKTVFEITDISDEERKTTLCGGGRYDRLVEALGGPKVPAVGWGMGAERVIELMQSKNISIPKLRGVEVVILEIGKKAKKVCKKMFNSLRENNINVFYVPSKSPLRNQLKNCTKMNAEFALIIGDQEASSNSVLLRDLKNSNQENISITGAIDLLKEKFNQP